ncbi:MAG: hypothetical protein WCI04_06005 [archaeon]
MVSKVMLINKVSEAKHKTLCIDRTAQNPLPWQGSVSRFLFDANSPCGGKNCQFFCLSRHWL